ncbi:MAG: hypothetical protein MUC63_10515 [Planctomycetes bacterium]|nr:hypothetical protein [Planctomycetota bacterium]
MAKATVPQAAFLVVELRGYADWAGQAGYAEALGSTEAFLAAVAKETAAWGGRVTGLEGDAVYALFGPSPDAGIAAAVRAGQGVLAAFRKARASFPKVEAGVAVHATPLPPSARPAKPSPAQAAALPKEVVRCASRALASVVPGATVGLTREAAAAAEGAVTTLPAAKPGALLPVRAVIRAKAVPRAGGPPVSPRALAEARLEPLRKEKAVAFSILAFRASRIESAPAPSSSTALKEILQATAAAGSAHGGETLGDTKDGVTILFPDAGSGEAAAQAALQTAFSSSGRLPVAPSPWLWGTGVASGTATLDQVARRGGDALRKVLGEARTLAQPRRGGRTPLADETTRSRVEGSFEFRSLPGGSRGTGRFEVLDLLPAAWLRRRLGIRGELPAGCLGPSGKPVQETFGYAEKDGSFLALGLAGETEAARAFGALFVLEEARRRGPRRPGSCSRARWRPRASRPRSTSPGRCSRPSTGRRARPPPRRRTPPSAGAWSRRRSCS